MPAQTEDNLPTDRQTQAGSAHGAPEGTFLLIEPIEHGFQAVGFNAAPRVRDHHLDRPVRGGARLNGHGSFGLGELTGIVQQLGQHFHQPFPIGPHGGQRFRHLRGNAGQSIAGHAGPNTAEGQFHTFRERQGFQVPINAPAFQVRQGEKILHQHAHSLRIAQGRIQHHLAQFQGHIRFRGQAFKANLDRGKGRAQFVAGDRNQVATGAIERFQLLIEIFEIGVGLGLHQGRTQLSGNRIHQPRFIGRPKARQTPAVMQLDRPQQLVPIAHGHDRPGGDRILFRDRLHQARLGFLIQIQNANPAMVLKGRLKAVLTDQRPGLSQQGGHGGSQHFILHRGRSISVLATVRNAATGAEGLAQLAHGHPHHL